MAGIEDYKVMCDFVSEGLKKASEHCLFEPNTPLTREKYLEMITPYLASLDRNLIIDYYLNPPPRIEITFTIDKDGKISFEDINKPVEPTEEIDH
jgi:hypothetical protein